MKSGLKIAVIGAGSTYTPELIEGFIKRKEDIDVECFCFYDIDDYKLIIVAGLVKRMLAAGGFNSRVVIAEDIREAVAGADFVIGQIRVGKLKARIRDEKIPLKHGLLGQETTGAGGFMNALRTIPAIMEIAAAIEKYAPDAWFINFSNPSGIIAEAVLNHTGVKLIGMCNGPVNLVKKARELLPDGIKVFDYDFVGLNHLCWITAIYADGREILREHLSAGDCRNLLKGVRQPGIDADVLKAVRGIPISYLNYFYFRDEKVRQCLQAEKSRGEECEEIEHRLLELYKDPNLDVKPDLLDKRGGALYSEAAVSLIDAMVNDKNEVHVVDVKNKGAYHFMDADDVVETKCIVGSRGAAPLKLGDFKDMYIIGMMQAVKAYEKLTVKAALEGDRNAALAALMVNPLVGDYHRSRGVLDEMLEANRAFLPQFFGGDGS